MPPAPRDAGGAVGRSGGAGCDGRSGADAAEAGDAGGAAAGPGFGGGEGGTAGAAEGARGRRDRGRGGPSARAIPEASKSPSIKRSTGAKVPRLGRLTFMIPFVLHGAATLSGAPSSSPGETTAGPERTKSAPSTEVLRQYSAEAALVDVTRSVRACRCGRAVRDRTIRREGVPAGADALRDTLREAPRAGS